MSATGVAEGLVDLEFTGQLHPHFEGVNGIGLFVRNCVQPQAELPKIGLGGRRVFRHGLALV